MIILRYCLEYSELMAIKDTSTLDYNYSLNMNTN